MADFYSNLINNDLRARDVASFKMEFCTITTLQHHKKQTLSTLGWEILPHPAYSPDLAPSDFSLFSRLKDPLRGIHFRSLEEIQLAIESWRKDVEKPFYEDAIKSLERKWEKCIKLGGDYIEK